MPKFGLVIWCSTSERARALTKPIVDCGARVIAIEQHRAWAASLRQRFAQNNVTVVEADALDLRLPRRPFRVVSNPPFAITVALLRRLVAREPAGTR